MVARTYGNLGLKAGYDLGEDGWDADMTLNILKLSILSQGRVLSKVSATPGGPAQGDAHICDETHATQPNKIAVYDNAAWVYITPLVGWNLWVASTARREIYDGTVWRKQHIEYYSVPFGFTTTPIADEILLIHVFSESVSIADDFAASAWAYVGTNPAASFVLTVKKNASAIGTLTISTGGAPTFATSGGGAETFDAGDVLIITGPTVADTTVANVAGTFRFTRT